MSLTDEFRALQAAGECVCDFDVACVVHPRYNCGACEYACHCDRHGIFSRDCNAECHDLVRGAAVPLALEAQALGAASFEAFILDREWLAGWLARPGFPEFAAFEEELS